MTADAKVGLLLGLFFIVIIAFLVNGLPNFIRQENPTTPDAAITTTAAPDMVLGSRVSDVVHRLNPPRVRQSQPTQEDIVLETAEQAALQIDMPALPQSPQTLQTPQVSQDNRTQQPLDVVQTPNLDQSQQTVPTQPVRQVASKTKTHTVQSGEILPAIAKKYYGDNQGNRRVVIQKLYEANSSVLKSPDKIYEGNKITIPPLEQLLNPSAGVVKAPSPSKSLLDSFPKVLKRVTKKETKTVSEYVVKDGESLWSIAQQQLGDGNRYKEIVKLNKNTIKNVNTVPSGAHIKIPLQ